MLRATDQQQTGAQIDSRWWSLTVLFLFYSFTYVDRSLVSLLIPEIKRTVEISDFAIGLILGTLPTVLFALASLPWGMAADRFSRKWIIGGGVALFTLSTVLLGFSHGTAAMMLARAIGAIGEAAIMPASYSFLTDTFPRKRIGTAIAIFSMGAKVGVAVPLALGGFVLLFANDLVAGGSAFGLFAWQIAFLIFAVPMIAGMLLTFTLKDPPRQHVRTVEGGQGAELKAYIKDQRRLLLLLTGGFAAVCFCGFSLQNWAPTYLARRFGMAPQEYGPVLAVMSVAAAMTLLIKGALIDYLYARGIKDAYVRLYTWFLAASLPIFWSMFWIENKWVFIALLGVVQVVTIPFISYASTTYQVIAPGNIRARITSAALIIFAIAGGLGTSTVGALNDFAFGGESGIGHSLALMVSVAVPISLLLLRAALPPLYRAVEASERAAAPAPQDQKDPGGA